MSIGPKLLNPEEIENKSFIAFSVVILNWSNNKKKKKITPFQVQFELNLGWTNMSVVDLAVLSSIRTEIETYTFVCC